MSQFVLVPQMPVANMYLRKKLSMQLKNTGSLTKVMNLISSFKIVQ